MSFLKGLISTGALNLKQAYFDFDSVQPYVRVNYQSGGDISSKNRYFKYKSREVQPFQNQPVKSGQLSHASTASILAFKLG